jgi:hypothetical protein
MQLVLLLLLLPLPLPGPAAGQWCACHTAAGAAENVTNNRNKAREAAKGEQ